MVNLRRHQYSVARGNGYVIAVHPHRTLAFQKVVDLLYRPVAFVGMTTLADSWGKFPYELVSEVVPKALPSFPESDIRCQQRLWESYIAMPSDIVTRVVAPLCHRQGRADF